MAGREFTQERILEVWNGSANVDELDALVTAEYLGHLGSRDRDLSQLKDDIVAYRRRAKDIQFDLVHRFSEGDYVASRWIARANDPVTGAPLSACGLNISRFEGALLAEEWAVWEALAARR